MYLWQQLWLLHQGQSRKFAHINLSQLFCAPNAWGWLNFIAFMSSCWEICLQNTAVCPFQEEWDIVFYQNVFRPRNKQFVDNSAKRDNLTNWQLQFMYNYMTIQMTSSLYVTRGVAGHNSSRWAKKIDKINNEQNRVWACMSCLLTNIAKTVDIF